MTIAEVFERKRILNVHPCFSKEAHDRFGRIHLPVAPACNIQCGYCIRKYDCANESRPGVTSAVLSPDEAIERVRVVLDRAGHISVIGIAGPGDPLANEATFEVLASVHREFPEIVLCISTNGLLLTEKLDSLISSGVKSITVTINAADPGTAARIYSRVSYKGTDYAGMAGAEHLVRNQWLGLEKAASAGMAVKVNTVFIPGVNDADIPTIACSAGRKGAFIMNIIPLLPQADFAHLVRPTHEMMSRMRRECGKDIVQMTHCRQCRADACGALGEDGDMELEMLHAKIGDYYCEMVL